MLRLGICHKFWPDNTTGDEVFKCVLQQREKNDAIRTVAMMRQGAVVDLNTSLSMHAVQLSLQYKHNGVRLLYLYIYVRSSGDNANSK